MRINHNIAALNTYRQLGQANQANSDSMQKLSSGLRINSAQDDAAGLAISEKMRGQIRGLEQASTNAQDANSMIQTAEGALNETQSILQRMRELAVQAGNDTNTTSDREEIQKEVNQLTSEVNRIGNTTEFNTQKLLDGGIKGSAEASGATLANGKASVSQQEAVYTIAMSDRANTNGNEISFDLDGKTYSATIDSSSDTSDDSSIGVSSNTTQAEDATDIAASINDWLGDQGLDSAWTAAESSGSVTITAQNGQAYEGAAGSGVITNFSADDADITSVSETTAGQDSASAEAATGTISFTNNMLASGTKIKIDDESFTLYDSSNGEIAPTASNNTGIDIKDMETSEELIDALVDNTGSVASATLSKQDTTTLSIQADSTGAGGNSIALEVIEPSGQTNAFTADFQIGANKGQSMSIEIGDMRASALGISSLAGSSNSIEIDGESYEVAWSESKGVTNGTDNNNTESGLSVSSHEDAAKAVEVLDAAIQNVSGERSKLGAYQNRLDHTVNNLSTSSENLTAAESRIRDVDYAFAA